MRLPNWYRVDNGGVGFYRAWNLHALDLVNHGFSTRIGGVAAAPYDTLNLAFTVNDSPENVIENRRIFAGAIGVDPGRIVVADQVHSNSVRLVNESDAGSGSVDHSDSVRETDALITNTLNLPLALHFADCTCVMLVDPINRAIGVAHAGWRGTVGKIVTATIEAMRREFGTSAESLQAAIGPSIARHCYEVGEDVVKEMRLIFPQHDYLLTPCAPGKWRADIKSANHILLIEDGVPDANIAISDACTSCDSDEFFSYRRDGVTGRMGGWLSLK